MKSLSSEIKISKDVFITICKIALAELDCVASVDKVNISGGLFDNYASQKSLCIELYIKIKQDCKIKTLADDINRIVAGNIVKMTGLSPNTIDLFITDMVEATKPQQSVIGG